MDADEFREAMRRLDLSFTKMAKAIGVTRRTVFRYASGKFAIPATVAILVRKLVAEIPSET